MNKVLLRNDWDLFEFAYCHNRSTADPITALFWAIWITGIYVIDYSSAFNTITSSVMQLDA